MLHLTTIGSQEDAALFILDNDITLEDRCSSLAERSGCGFRSDFTYTNPVLNTSTNEYEFELTDVSPVYQTVPQLRMWRIADAGSTAKFVRPGGFKKYDTRVTVKIRVPITEDFVTIILSNTTLIPFCQSVVPKIIYFGCPYPDWNYVNDKTIQFTTKNAEPGTQVLWKFGDNNSSSSTNQNPQFHYANADCPDKVVVDFVITAQDPSTNPNCYNDFNPLRIEVGPKEFLLHKKARGWKTVGGKKFKWSVTAKGRPNLFGIYTGLSSVRGFIKYKEQRNNGKWRTKRTNLKIRLEGGLFRYTDCTWANDLTTATSEKSKNNRRRLWKLYTSTTPFQINVNDPIKAYFEAGSMSGTFTVFN